MATHSKRRSCKYVDDAADASSDSGDDSENGSQQSKVSDLIDDDTQSSMDSETFYRRLSHSSNSKKRRALDSDDEDAQPLANVCRTIRQGQQWLEEEEERWNAERAARAPPRRHVLESDTESETEVVEPPMAQHSDEPEQDAAGEEEDEPTIPNPDMIKRIGTHSFVEFYDDGEGGQVKIDLNIAIDEAVKNRYNDFSPELKRVLKHPHSPICFALGQMERAPSTGTLHFQGMLKLLGKRKGKSDKEIKMTSGVLAARLRALLEDDETMNKVDGLKYMGKGKFWKFNLQPAISHPANLKAYCSKEFNDDGTAKRAFGEVLIWDLYNGMLTDEVRNGSTMDQLTAMALGGGAGIDMLQRYGGTALMHYKKLKEVSQEVKEAKEKENTVRRCGNIFCGLKYTNDADARFMAEDMGLELNEVIARLKEPCTSQAVYCWGDAGTGKSSFTYNLACAKHSPSNVFIKPTGEYWGSSAGMGGCGYTSETALVIHDISSAHWPTSTGQRAQGMNEFKRIVDCTKADVPTKGGTRPLKVRNFYFDGNENPVEFFMSLCGDLEVSKLQIEYGAFVRRIKIVYHYQKSADSHVTVVGQKMPSWTSVLSTFNSRRIWQVAKNGTCPQFIMEAADAPEVINTHRSLESEAQMYMFKNRRLHY